MTISAVYGGQHWTDFATNRGMGDFSRWTDDLDEKQYPLLVHLSDHGWVNDLTSLLGELEKAIAQTEPSESLKKTLDSFRRELQKYHDDAETIMLTDGMGP